LVGSTDDLLFYRIKEDPNADDKLDVDSLMSQVG
jgi:hypothetical protein